MKPIKRTFFPGDNWIYFKIYTGVIYGEKLLLDPLYRTVKYLTKQNLIQKWFFLRYADPDFHIRIRLYASDKQNIGHITKLINSRLFYYCTNRIIYRIDISTYSRELERYGANNIEITEQLFDYDSHCICSILKSIQDSDSNYRWMAAFKLIDSFLNTLNYTPEQKYACIQGMNDSYLKEFGYTKYNAKQLNALYRLRKKTIEQILSSTKTEDERMENIKQIIRKNHRSIAKKLVNIPADLNVASCIHMSMNRLFMSENRIHELLIYNFLSRYYLSELAKMKK